MSTVRVSSGSPTLERMEARQTEGSPKPSACRSLFGPVDHVELARELRRHRSEAEEAARARWEFDFLREQPLRGPEGRFEWRALRKDALPDFYSRPPRLSRRWGHGGGSGDGPPVAGKCWHPWKRARELSAYDEEEEEGPLAAQAGGEGPPSSRKRPVSDDSCLPNKRANMTEEAISEGSSSASSVEQTPKKSSPRHHQT